MLCEQNFEQIALFTHGSNSKWDRFYRCPNMIVSTKGTVFAFPSVHVNTIGDYVKTEFCCRRSFDHCRTWTDMEVMRTDEDLRVGIGYNSGVADLETGRVLVFYSVYVVITPDDIGGGWVEKWESEHPEEAAAMRRKLRPDIEKGIYVVWTDDEGETWSDPQQIGDALYVVNPVTGEKRRFVPQWVGIQLRYGPRRGRLILPGNGETKGSPYDIFAYSHNCTVYSDDHGCTWQIGGLAQTGTGEACLIEEIDGTVYLNSRNESLRSRGYRAWDRSYDGGETFIKSGYDLGLPEPHCEASMVRYSGPTDGRSRVLFCNPAMTTDTSECYENATRRNLTVRISYDECRTWPIGRTVCEGHAGYSGLAVTNDGWILCAYETTDSQGCTGDIILTRFNLVWLTQDQKEQL